MRIQQTGILSLEIFIEGGHGYGNCEYNKG